jgi:hypothetical protein
LGDWMLPPVPSFLNHIFTFLCIHDGLCLLALNDYILILTAFFLVFCVNFVLMNCNWEATLSHWQ